MEEFPNNNSEQATQLDPAMQSLANMADQMGEGAEKEQGSKVNRIYGEIAKNALMNWSGLSEQEASERVATSTFEELESQIGAEGSITAAVNSIMENLEERAEVESAEGRELGEKLIRGLTGEKDGGEDFDESMGMFSEKLGKVIDKEEFVLDVLDGVHEKWIKDNMNKLNDHNRVGKRYQFMPLSVIGFKEAMTDLIFVKPILEAAGMKIDQDELQDAYDDYAGDFSTTPKHLFDTDNKYVRYKYGPDFVIDFKEKSPQPYEFVLRILESRAKSYQQSTDENFEIDFSNVEWGDVEVLEKRWKEEVTPDWEARQDKLWATPVIAIDGVKLEQERTEFTGIRKPTSEEQKARYAMEVANQIIDKLKADRQ